MTSLQSCFHHGHLQSEQTWPANILYQLSFFSLTNDFLSLGFHLKLGIFTVNWGGSRVPTDESLRYGDLNSNWALLFSLLLFQQELWISGLQNQTIVFHSDPHGLNGAHCQFEWIEDELEWWQTLFKITTSLKALFTNVLSICWCLSQLIFH